MKRRLAFLAVAVVAALTAAVAMTPGNASAATAVAGGPYYGTVGVPITFNAAGSVGTTCSWNFNDGTTGTGCVTQKTYTQPGTYGVILTVTDNAGTATAMTTAFISGGGAYVPTPGYTCGSACPGFGGYTAPCWFGFGCGGYAVQPQQPSPLLVCPAGLGCWNLQAPNPCALTCNRPPVYVNPGCNLGCGGSYPQQPSYIPINSCGCSGSYPQPVSYIPVNSCGYCGLPSYLAGQYVAPTCNTWWNNTNPCNTWNWGQQSTWQQYDPWWSWRATNTPGSRVPVCNVPGTLAVLCR